MSHRRAGRREGAGSDPRFLPRHASALSFGQRLHRQEALRRQLAQWARQIRRASSSRSGLVFHVYVCVCVTARARDYVPDFDALRTAYPENLESYAASIILSLSGRGSGDHSGYCAESAEDDRPDPRRP